MQNFIQRNWPIAVVVGSALFCAAVAGTAFRGHHWLSGVFIPAFGYAGGYLGYKACEAMLRRAE